MDEETRSQIGDLDNLRSAHKARLHVLEIQAARQGNSAPPEVTIEIGDIKTKLVPIDAAIFKLTYVGTIRADIPGNGRGDNVGIAVERTLERERRAYVARLSDAELYADVKLTAAIDAMRYALRMFEAMALASLLLSVGMLVYIVAKGGL